MTESAAHPLHVVIADDSHEQRSILRQLAESMGCQVTEAADGRALFWVLEALGRRRLPGDVLVLADLRMPVYDGLEVLEAWQQLRAPYRFALITSFPDEDVGRRVRALSGVLLPKPFRLAEVRELLSAAR